MAGPEHDGPAGSADAPPPDAAPGDADGRPRRRVARRLGASVLALVALAALALGAAAWVAAHLDHPSVAPRLEALAADALGAPVTWDRLSVDLASGRLSARGVAVAQPEPLDAHAPTALRVDALDGRIDLPALARGAVRVDGLHVRGVALTEVTTPDRSTTAALFPGDPDDDAPATPPSASLDALRGLDVRVAGLRIDGVDLAWIDVDPEGRVTRSTLGPVALRGDAAPAEGGLGAELELDLDGARVEAGALGGVGPDAEAPGPGARLGGGATLAVRPLAGGGANTTLSVDVELREPSLLPGLAVDPARLEAELEVRLLPDEERIGIALTRLSALDGALEATLAGTVRDARPDALVDARGDAHVRVDALPWRVPGLTVDDVALDLTAEGATLAPDAVEGRLRVVGRAAAVRYAPPAAGAEDPATDPAPAGAPPAGGARQGPREPAPPGHAALTGVRLEGTVTSGGPAAIRLEASDVDVEGGGARLAATDARVGVAGDTWLDALLAGEPPAADVTLAAASLDARAAGVAVRAEALATEARVDLGADRHAGRIAAARLSLRAGGDAVTATGADLAVRADRPLALGDVSDAGATVTLEGPVRSLVAPGASLRGARLDVALRRPPGRATYALDGDVAVASAVVAGRRLDGARRLSVEGEVDPARLDGDLRLALSGAAGPELSLDASADTGGGTLDWRVGLGVSRLAPLLALAGLDGRGLTVEGVRVDAGGDVAGVLVPGPAGARRVAAAPRERLRGAQRVEIALDGVAYEREDLSVRAPSMRLRVAADHRDAGSEVTLAWTAPTVHARAGDAASRLDDVDVEATLALGPGVDASAFRFEVRARVGAVDDARLEPVPVRDLVVAVDGTWDPRAVRVSALRLTHEATGTALEATVDWERVAGAGDPADAVPGREAVVVEGALVQDVALAASLGLADRARGRLRVPFRVASGDLVAWDVALALVPDDVDLALVGGRWAVEGLSGTVPVTQVVTLADGGVRIDAGRGAQRLARNRFSDVQPFLGGDDWLSAERLVVLGEPVGPLAGNLRVSGTTFALDRLQVAWREGVVTGQLLVDWPTLADRPRDTTAVTFRGNATGIRLPGSDEVLDANGALVLRPASLQLDGTVHVVRVGRSHLRALLDAFDPYHEDVSANRVRAALRVGYPEYVRLRVREGTLDAKVDLGGLAGAVRIDEIRSVPVGPLLARWVRPILDAIWPAPQAAPEAGVPEAAAPPSSPGATP